MIEISKEKRDELAAQLTEALVDHWKKNPDYEPVGAGKLYADCHQRLTKKQRRK